MSIVLNFIKAALGQAIRHTSVLTSAEITLQKIVSPIETTSSGFSTLEADIWLTCTSPKNQIQRRDQC